MADDQREFCAATGKLIHRRPQLAARACKSQARNGKKTEVYRCEHCGFWHTGRGAKIVKIQRVVKLRDNYVRVGRLNR